MTIRQNMRWYNICIRMPVMVTFERGGCQLAQYQVHSWSKMYTRCKLQSGRVQYSNERIERGTAAVLPPHPPFQPPLMTLHYIDPCIAQLDPFLMTISLHRTLIYIILGAVDAAQVGLMASLPSTPSPVNVHLVTEATLCSSTFHCNALCYLLLQEYWMYNMGLCFLKLHKLEV